MSFPLLAAYDAKLAAAVTIFFSIWLMWAWIRSRKIPNRIVKRREELLEEIKAVFPDPTSHSREALTDKIDVIVTHDVWFKQLQTLSREIVNFTFNIILFILFLGLFRTSMLSIIPLTLALIPWIFWVALLRWAESWGNSPNTTTVLGVIIPSGVLIVPEALIYTGVWRLPQYWLWRRVIEEGYLLSFLLGVALIATTLCAALDALVKVRQRWRDPRAHLMKALLHALREVVALKEGPRWANPEARQSIIPDLEDAAACLEVIPKKFPDRDRFSSTWNQQAYLRRASGIRDRKKWVLLPKAETRDNLEVELRRVLELVAFGDWDGLPQEDLPQDAPVPWWRQALVLVRSIIIAAIPLVAVNFFGKYLQPDFKTFVTDVAWIWAVISLLAMLDPRFGEKLSVFKGLTDYLPFVGKSKGRD